MRVYISGKIGEEVLSDATAQKFARAEAMLYKTGRFSVVFNPCDVAVQCWLKQQYDSACIIGGCIADRYSYYLIKTMVEMYRGEAVYMLADWKLSPGARAEYHTAMAMGKRMFFQDRTDAAEHVIHLMREQVKRGNPPGYYLEKKPLDAEIECIKRDLDKAWLPI